MDYIALIASIVHMLLEKHFWRLAGLILIAEIGWHLPEILMRRLIELKVSQRTCCANTATGTADLGRLYLLRSDCVAALIRLLR